MFRINHNEAIELEYQVRKLYGCDRAGVSGMADADYFEGHPIQAAVLVVAYVHAKGLESGPYLVNGARHTKQYKIDSIGTL